MPQGRSPLAPCCLELVSGVTLDTLLSSSACVLTCDGTFPILCSERTRRCRTSTYSQQPVHNTGCSKHHGPIDGSRKLDTFPRPAHVCASNTEGCPSAPPDRAPLTPELQSRNTLGLRIEGRSKGWAGTEGFMEEVAMNLEKWSEVETGRRGWGREEFHASETTDVQGRGEGLGWRVGQLPRVGWPTSLHRRVLCGPRQFGALGNDSPSQPGCLPPPIGVRRGPRGRLTAATGRRGAMSPLGTKASELQKRGPAGLTALWGSVSSPGDLR